MAKTASETLVKGRKGVGWRYCSACDCSTKGPRSTKCEKCGVPFPVKTPKAPGQPKGTVAKQLDLEAALPLVNEMGGVKALQTAIEAYRKAEATLAQIGGVENAEALHAKLELLRTVLGK